MLLKGGIDLDWKLLIVTKKDDDFMTMHMFSCYKAQATKKSIMS